MEESGVVDMEELMIRATKQLTASSVTQCVRIGNDRSHMYIHPASIDLVSVTYEHEPTLLVKLKSGNAITWRYDDLDEPLHKVADRLKEAMEDCA